MSYEIALEGGSAHTVGLARRGDRATVTIDGNDYHGSLRPAGDGWELTLEDRTEPMWIVVERDTVHVHAFGRAWQLSVIDPVERARGGGPSEDVATAPMPGAVISVAVAAGDAVEQGQQLLVIESMKMQNEIVAARDGVVERVHVEVGETFDRGAALVALVAEDDGDED
ncbi:acetyl-CoA carboxylase biotin carboxyl carrier protein subunit [Conexibacter sp. CPCC 206217]|uniref:acetyl-CoA carboxylase biotin carboxyl carrier protein subunit n=1 Tax=Conexibacter sp. CPCC 206217 TaxID=3064574 RepID=UPI00271D1BB9|nr:biotin/lipoyl-containing protein [Conexibacter sp. CPCC 206217]MDO8212423.1 biotin/lipoyl-containing protein [Conexibacter sp. CPCC 206217]